MGAVYSGDVCAGWGGGTSSRAVPCDSPAFRPAGARSKFSILVYRKDSLVPPAPVLLGPD